MQTTRFEIFSRPPTLEKLIKGRKNFVEVSQFQDIAPAHERRGEDEIVLITPGVQIIPSDFYSGMNFTKRGEHIVLETFNGNADELMRNEWSLLKAMIRAADETPENLVDLDSRRIAGWNWIDIDGKTHYLHPWEVFEGNRLHLVAFHDSSIENQIEIRQSPYSSSDSNLRTARVLVPSRQNPRKHNVLVEHLTDSRDPQRFAEWTRISSRHFSALKREMFTFREDSYEVYDSYDVAAQLRWARQVGEEQGRIAHIAAPLVTEPALRLYLALMHDTLKLEFNPETGKTRTRKLNIFEINPVMMDTWLRYGNKATHYVHSPTRTYNDSGKAVNYKRMRDFDLTPSGRGMPFIDKKAL